MSLLVSAAVLLASASALVLAARAIPDGTGSAAAVVSGARILDQIGYDLYYASAAPERGLTSLTLSLPDRDGDGAGETVRYAWSGVVGDPLTRSYNGGAPDIIAKDVWELAFGYQTRAEQLPATSTEGPEVLLSSYTGSVNLADYSLNTKTWAGQYFVPSLPPNATAWSVTQVLVYARSNGTASGQNYLQMRTATSGLPGAVVEEVAMPESGFGASYAWKPYLFSRVSGLAPTTGLCLVARFASSGPSGFLRYQGSGVPSSTSRFLSTSNGDSGWVANGAASMFYSVYGRVTTTAGPQSVYRLTNVRTSLRLGGNTASRLDSSLPVVNEPQIGGP